MEPDELEYIGMGPDCAECGNPTSWLPCWNCGGEGGRDGEDLMEEDPLWYSPEDYEVCGECLGNGGWNYCIECKKIVKVKKDDIQEHNIQENGPYGHWHMTLTEPIMALWRWIVRMLKELCK